jgi:hypothetical protein
MATRFRFTRYGLIVDPVGEYVGLEYKGRRLLGEVVSVKRDEYVGVIRVRVKHFNGEPWPIDPALSALDWIHQGSEK